MLYIGPYCYLFYILLWKWKSLTAKSLQSCSTLCDPIDRSPPGSPVPGILQARTLEWVAISFSNAWKWKVKGKSLSRVRLLETPWTAAHQAPPSMGFSRQEYWSGVPLPSPESLSVVSNSLPPQGLYSPWNSPGQNTGVGSFSLLRGIFPTQRSSCGLLHCRQILYQLSYQGSPIHGYVYMSIPTSQLSCPSFPPVTMFIFYICDSISVL